MSRLDVERVSSRVSAYVYGNVLVLAAVVGCTPESVDDGRAVVIVLATMVTTYLAHVVAHRVGAGIGRSTDEAETHLRAELRDAVPIATSGLVPAGVLLVAALDWLDWLGTSGSQLVAVLVVVVRLGLTGSVASRLGSGSSSRRTVWSAVGLAVAGSLIAVVKVLLTH